MILLPSNSSHYLFSWVMSDMDAVCNGSSAVCPDNPNVLDQTECTLACMDNSYLFHCVDERSGTILYS